MLLYKWWYLGCMIWIQYLLVYIQRTWIGFDDLTIGLSWRTPRPAWKCIIYFDDLFPLQRAASESKRESVRGIFPAILHSGNDCYIAIENGYRNSEFPMNGMVIFHSYVSLPEGTCSICSVFGATVDRWWTCVHEFTWSTKNWSQQSIKLFSGAYAATTRMDKIKSGSLQGFDTLAFGIQGWNMGICYRLLWGLRSKLLRLPRTPVMCVDVWWCLLLYKPHKYKMLHVS